MQKRNEPTHEDIIEFKNYTPLEIGKAYIVNGYRLSSSIKTRNILRITAYPTQAFREENLKRGLRAMTVNVEVYREALVKVGLFQAMENKFRKAENSLSNSGAAYKLAKELLLEATTQERQ